MATAKINLAELADATDRLGLIQDKQLNICDSFSQRQNLLGGFWSRVIFLNVVADRPLRFGRAKQIYASDRWRQLPEARHIALRKHVPDQKRITKRVDWFIVAGRAEL